MTTGMRVTVIGCSGSGMTVSPWVWIEGSSTWTFWFCTGVPPSSAGFTFSGRGYGHGVGLCQAGALARLKTGASVNAVLAHYFPGTTVTGS